MRVRPATGSLMFVMFIALLISKHLA